MNIHRAINLAISSLWLVGDNLDLGFSTGFKVCTSLMIGQKVVINRRQQIICSEHSLIKRITSLAICFLFAGMLPVYGLIFSLESSSLLASQGGNTDSDVFDSQQMIKEEPKMEPQYQPQEEGLRYEQPVDRIEPTESYPQQIPQRNVKRGKPAPDIREVQPDGRSLPQNFDNMKKKVKQKKRSRKEAAEEMPPVAPKIAPISQTRKTDPQEESLTRLVHELEFGTLSRSITMLRGLVRDYPEDSDYKKLLDMSLALQDADTWYSYQRHTPSPTLSQSEEPQKKPELKPIPQIQASSDNPRVNELKKSSWLLIRNNYKKNN